MSICRIVPKPHGPSQRDNCLVCFSSNLCGLENLTTRGKAQARVHYYSIILLHHSIKTTPLRSIICINSGNSNHLVRAARHSNGWKCESQRITRRLLFHFLRYLCITYVSTTCIHDARIHTYMHYTVPLTVGVRKREARKKWFMVKP